MPIYCRVEIAIEAMHDLGENIDGTDGHQPQENGRFGYTALGEEGTIARKRRQETVSGRVGGEGAHCRRQRRFVLRARRLFPARKAKRGTKLVGRRRQRAISARRQRRQAH